MEFNFEKLSVYQKSNVFLQRIYLITKSFPKDEVFGLTSQLRRAGVAIIANIAEGSAKSQKDFCRYIEISRGSVYECAALLDIAHQQNYINPADRKEFREMLVEISKMLSGLQRSLTKPVQANKN